MLVKIRKRFTISEAIIIAIENKIKETTCKAVLKNGSFLNCIALFSENGISLQRAVKVGKTKIKADSAKESKVLAKLKTSNGTGVVVELVNITHIIFK